MSQSQVFTNTIKYIFFLVFFLLALISLSDFHCGPLEVSGFKGCFSGYPAPSQPEESSHTFGALRCWCDHVRV